MCKDRLASRPPVAADAFDGRAYAARLTASPGVYRMLAADHSALYVGKAASLRKRVGSYFSKTEHGPRIAAMLRQVAAIEVTITRTESEALLLENQLIKSLRPRYNILLRDDKSYPYVRLGVDDWPRLAFYRGSRKVNGRLFGPYPSAFVVRSTLGQIHKLFRLRSCEDSVFRGRSRPCLQYQIKRCSGPCVGLIGAAEYADSVRRATWFLEGRNSELIADLDRSMAAAAAALEFERAGAIRDQIAELRSMQARQYVEGDVGDADVLVCELAGGVACVLLLCLRAGLVQGTQDFFLQLHGETAASEVLAAFVTQHYLAHPPPREIWLPDVLADAALIAAVLSERSGDRVVFRTAPRGERARFVELAQRNAEAALTAHLATAGSQTRRMEALRELLNLTSKPSRIECFDISHTQGEATVASCVVFDALGAVRAQYRRFNIADIAPGDDCAAMRQALERRFKRGLVEGVLPDLLLIDGGRGQLAQACAVLNGLGVTGLVLVGVAKGAERRAGYEKLLLTDGRELAPGPASPALHLIAQVRDEAHRFAITGHRQRRAKSRETSTLQDIEGIGPRRRVKLLRHFGGLAGLKRAGVEEITRVEGIDIALARRIFAALHGVEASETG